MPVYLLKITAPAERDLRNIFLWSQTEFGDSAADRYEALIAQAFADLVENPFRPGAKQRQDLFPGIYTYHLVLSREHVLEDRVKSPRHFLVYRVIANHIDILRVLHDSRDLDRHIPRA